MDMIKKGYKVFWKHGDRVLSGIVVETYPYKITKNISKFIKGAEQALYIRKLDGSHVLKNDNEVRTTI